MHEAELRNETRSKSLARRTVLTMAAALTGCQAMPPPAPVIITQTRLGAGGNGYINLRAPFVPQVGAAFAMQVAKLVELKATRIYVIMNSPGGIVPIAEGMIRLMADTTRVHGIPFTTHNVGVVASAACYVFRAGDRRVALPKSLFLFHEASVVPTSGALTSQGLQDASSNMQRVERSFLSMLTRRTHLSEAEASSFIRRTVILSPSEALRDGIIQEIALLRPDPGATVFNIGGAPQPPKPVTSAPPS